MTRHAKSLRVIGQTLEVARVTTFKLEKHAKPYHLWIADRLFSFGPADISRLDAKAQKRRKHHSSCMRRPTSLSQQLRTLGGYLDRIEVSSFRIVWTDGSALLDYKRVNGERNCRTFTAEELRHGVRLGIVHKALGFHIPRQRPTELHRNPADDAGATAPVGNCRGRNRLLP